MNNLLIAFKVLLIKSIAICFLAFPSQAQTIVTDEPEIPDTSGIVISQNSTYLMVGQDMEITVLGCSANVKLVSVTINGREIAHDENGLAVLQTPSGSLGIHMVPVEVVYVDRAGERQVKEHTVIFEVGQANVSVVPNRLNILYIGIDNPVSILASVGSHRIIVQVSGGGASISSQGSGNYLVRVTKLTDDCTLTVLVDNKHLGSYRFRARHIPLPIAKAGNYISGSKVTGKELSAVSGIIGVLEDFSFDVRYKTMAYRIQAYSPDGTVKNFVVAGSEFSDESKRYFAQLPAGSLVVIRDILLEEPRGRKISVPAIVLHVK